VKREFMPIYVDDLLAETASLSAAQFGAYMHLLMHYWHHREIPTDDRRLALIVRDFDGRKWPRWKLALAPLFNPDWTHPKVKVELEKKRIGGGWGILPQPPNRCQTEVWRATRLRIFERDDFTCQYCGQRGGKLECDHKIPASRGGSDEDDNLTTACISCNRQKCAMTIEEWRQ
jgi:hypothetical protein